MAIYSIANFVTELQKIPKIKGTELFFRGHSDENYKLKPSIYRKRKLIINEHKLFKEFILRTPSDFLNENSALEKLVKMQHYGLPTRLLDITTNALVALYFACIGKENRNGNVIAFRIPHEDIKYYDSDTVSILSNIAKRSTQMDIRNVLQLKLNDFNENKEIKFLLHEIKEEKSYFKSIINPEDIGRVVAVKVKQSNNRIIKQSGAFLIFGIDGIKRRPATINSKWILNLEEKGVGFHIDKDSKGPILKELNAVGINESTLFPEMENQAKYLIKEYG